MAIVLARVDNRLIHGQVLEAWVPSTRTECIVVANNRVAEEELSRLLMAAAVPRGIRVVIGSIEYASAFLCSPDGQALRTLVLFDSPADALRAHDLGVPFAELNLGNLQRLEGKKRVSCSVAFDQEDIQSLNALEAQGVKIHIQCVPSERQRNWRVALASGC
ncbi:PTS sugar transporter subunit IIB [Desulfuromonas sp. CSMB_57]|jgi:PTS system mannose-specific IIB component|uniref:PTS system mannose/fructose/N-acetylgalactosamine-transporter subunit IIB n=1 Tax=Desulfuromonas sp. CSMB_57 TaxID=2807629 RepID=UPI001CD390D4|nr:PTS sugar transporter subunit IIB [Desulfuromonas sp. CSMB_57]